MAADAAGAVSTQAKRAAILSYIHELQKHKKTLVGVQVNEFEVYLDCTSYDRVVESTQDHPSIMGLELMGAIAYPPYEAYLIDRAATQEAAGGLVTMSWHHRNPLEVCTRGEFYDCTKRPITPEALHAMLTPGTPENKLWLADVDALGKVLGDLRARGIVILFRPYHEMNGPWFWWGQKDEYPQLWDALYDELAVHLKLDNLIWVWSGDRLTPDPKRYFPQRHKPDVVGIDVYEPDPNTPIFTQGRASVTSQDPKIPFALTEVGKVPSPQTVNKLNPAWVLLWGEAYLNPDWSTMGPCATCNKPEEISAFLKLPRMIMRDQLPAALRATISAGVTNDHPLHRADPYCPAKLD